MIQVRQAIPIIEEYLVTNYRLSEFIFYGSYVELYRDYICTPQDIDIIVITYGNNNINGTSLIANIDGIDLPVSINFMNKQSIIDEVNNLEPKYFNIISSSPELNSFLTNIYETLCGFKKFEIRNAISKISSKAYNKGKKKLIVHDDIDEYLGLKNIHHAFKFISNALWFYNDSHCDLNLYEINRQKHIWYLKDINDLINTTYSNSTGTREERFKQLDEVIKPIYNKLMTEFRKQFPKELV